MADDSLLGFTNEAAPAAAAAPEMGFVDSNQMGFVAQDPMQFQQMAPQEQAFDQSPLGFAPPTGSGGGYADPFAGVPVKDSIGDFGGSMPEMTALREWEDKHEKELEEKSRKEEGDKKVRREAAYAEIQAWKEERDLNMKKKRDTNRLDEETTGAAAGAKPVSENPWERVVELIDTAARSSEDSRDVARMRNLLIQLKANPPEKKDAKEEF